MQRLDPNLPYQTLIDLTTAATLQITNQKNGKKNQTIHHTSTYQPDCPVKALARRLHHIHTFATDPHITIISTYFSPQHPEGQHLRPTTITSALRQGVLDLQLHLAGFTIKQISTHSLRAGGAMALHLNGVQAHLIKKVGRWSSDTFITYIHEQIAAVSANLATVMTNNIPFHNIQGPQLQDPAEDH
jgi:hypothetical protein